MSKYLDSTGLSYFWGKIKSALNQKLDASNAYTHPTYVSIPSGLYKVTVDGTGHVSGVNAVTKADITGLGIPGSNLDTKVNVTLGTTTKAYLLGTSTAPTSTAQGVTAISDTGVYLDTTAGKLTAASFAGNGACLTSLNGSNISSGTVAADRIASLPASKIGSGTIAAARLPAASASAAGAMSAADYSKLAAFGAASTYATKSDIANAYVYKGSVAEYENLPTADRTVGDVYNVSETGMNYAWTGSSWDALGIEITPIPPNVIANIIMNDSFENPDYN